jgi:hypothetical protein
VRKSFPRDLGEHLHMGEDTGCKAFFEFDSPLSKSLLKIFSLPI